MGTRSRAARRPSTHGPAEDAAARPRAAPLAAPGEGQVAPRASQPPPMAAGAAPAPAVQPPLPASEVERREAPSAERPPETSGAASETSPARRGQAPEAGRREDLWENPEETAPGMPPWGSAPRAAAPAPFRSVSALVADRVPETIRQPPQTGSGEVPGGGEMRGPSPRSWSADPEGIQWSPGGRAPLWTEEAPIEQTPRAPGGPWSALPLDAAGDEPAATDDAARWPSLPSDAAGGADRSDATGLASAAAAERRRRIDLEQRGVAWNG